MKRILLFFQADADFQTRHCIEQLSAGLGNTHSVQCLTVGPGGDCRHLPAAAWRLLHTDADLIHAWGDRCLRVAGFAHKPVLFTPAPLPTSAAAKWLRSARPHLPVRSVCLSTEDHRYLIEHGVPADLCDLVRAGVKLGQRLTPDSTLRSQLGAAATDCLILLAGDAEPWLDPPLAVQSTAILHYLDPRYRLLITGGGRDIQRLLTLAVRTAPTLLINAAERLGHPVNLPDLIPAANLAICPAPNGVPPLPILACMAGGLPLVGLATRATSELIEDHHTALLAPAKFKKLAQRLLQLAEDPALAHRLADEARAQAYKLFPVSRFLSEMRIVYDKTVSTPTKERRGVSPPVSPQDAPRRS